MTRKKLDAAAAAITKRFGVNVIGVLEGAIVDPIPVRSEVEDPGFGEPKAQS